MDALMTPKLPENPIKQRNEDIKLSDILMWILIGFLLLWALVSVIQVIWYCNIKPCIHRSCYKENDSEQNIQTV